MASNTTYCTTVHTRDKHTIRQTDRQTIKQFRHDNRLTNSSMSSLLDHRSAKASVCVLSNCIFVPSDAEVRPVIATE